MFELYVTYASRAVFSLRINPDLSCDSCVRPERRRNERFLSGLRWSPILFLPCLLPSRAFFFNFWKGGKKAIRTYVRSEKNNKCYGSCIAEPAPAINHVSRVLKSTSKFSFKSHAVRFIKEHYWSPLLCNSCTRRPEIRAYVLSPFLIFSLSLHLPHYYSTSIHYYPVAPIYISRMHTLSRGLDYKLTT